MQEGEVLVNSQLLHMISFLITDLDSHNSFPMTFFGFFRVFFPPESRSLLSCWVLLNFTVVFPFVAIHDGFSHSKIQISDMLSPKIPFICQPIFYTNSYQCAFHYGDCSIVFFWSIMVIYFFCVWVTVVQVSVMQLILVQQISHGHGGSQRLYH